MQCSEKSLSEFQKYTEKLCGHLALSIPYASKVKESSIIIKLIKLVHARKMSDFDQNDHRKNDELHGGIIDSATTV